MNNLHCKYQALCEKLAQLAKENPLREPLKLLAVSKYATPEAVQKLYEIGQKAFAENYWQSAKEKMEALKDLKIEWHFIGGLQSNKCAEIASHFTWVHTLAKIKHVALLAHAKAPASQNQAFDIQDPLQICLQVNLSQDSKKYGVLPENLVKIVEEVLRYPQLHLRGLMVLPKPGETKDFIELAKLRNQLEKDFQLELPTLSMGMSGDYEEAIKAGATIVRIGSLLFL